ncbi:hypothetical protein [uncultured Cohaesibacter sp.]|uniref:hypothetical protein n=1 Tax=uncultured Cohaesibacter sp. TaxID=1002546 RepID=UPI00293072F3|nr:hypothetical protein [uncultured Cohaesibacter sp.]
MARAGKTRQETDKEPSQEANAGGGHRQGGDKGGGGSIISFTTALQIYAAIIIAIAVGILTPIKPEGPIAVWIAVALLLFIFVIATLGLVDRDKLSSWVGERDNFKPLYTHRVRSFDKAISRMIEPENGREAPKPKGWLARFFWYQDPKAHGKREALRLRRDAFSWPVMDVALKLAIIYPLYFLLLQWAITNEPTGIGEYKPLLPAEWHWRLVFMATPLFLFWTELFPSSNPNKRWKRLWESLYGATVAAFIIVSIAFINEFSGQEAFVSVIVGLIVFSVIFKGLVIGVCTGITAIAFAGIVTNTLSDLSTISFASVGTFTIAPAFGYLIWRKNSKLTYFLICILGMITGVLAIFFLSQYAHFQSRQVFVFAICILPLVNAVFDYLSYGTTLSLLRAGLKGGRFPTLVYGLMDIGLALVYLFGLSLTLCLIIAGINALSVHPFLPLGELLQDLGDSEKRGGYAWLYVSLLSTLVPTSFHLCIVLVSATTWLPMPWKAFFKEKIQRPRNEFDTALGLGGFSLFFTLYLLILILAIMELRPWIIANFKDGPMFLLDTVSWALHLMHIL